MFFYSIFVLIVSHMVNSFYFLAMLLKPGCFALNLLKMFLSHRTSIFLLIITVKHSGLYTFLLKT